jgi:tRNA 2-selenouridine synthase
VPLLDDAERALVGTLYRRQSPQVAYDAGLAAVGERIAELVGRVAALAGWSPAADVLEAFARATAGGLDALEHGLAHTRPATSLERPVVLHCWRGGLRSRSVVALLRALGLDRAVALEGGYRAFRRQVLEDLERWEAPPTFVLRGLTGVGKTLVLRELERLRPGWTVDLEGLAGHRSSILGMVGLDPVPQKRFDSSLHARLGAVGALRPGHGGGPLVMEGESRKVGDAILPARVWEALQAGSNALLEAPLERRIDVLIEDYLGDPDNRPALRAQLPFIEQRLGPVKWEGALVALLDAGRERELVQVLLERYYDPLYLHSERGRDYGLRVDTSDPTAAAEELAAWIEAQTLRRRSASPSRAWARSS